MRVFPMHELTLSAHVRVCFRERLIPFAEFRTDVFEPRLQAHDVSGGRLDVLFQEGHLIRDRTGPFGHLKEPVLSKPDVEVLHLV